jgi:hypothetical protein
MALSDQYSNYLNEIEPIEVGKYPCWSAAKTGKRVVMADVLEEPVFGALAADRAGRALPSDDLDAAARLSVLADHAAITIRTAHLLEDSLPPAAGPAPMVRSLRAQAHEHSNRLHARRLIAAVEDGYHGSYASATGRIENPSLAGFLVAETSIALQSDTTVAPPAHPAFGATGAPQRSRRDYDLRQLAP